MDFFSIVILVVLGIWFVSVIVFLCKRKGKGCGSCCMGCEGCSQRKGYERTCQKEDKK